ncbi:MAG: hypothetical protein RIK87_24290 [Fuerstiella sp.]
MTADTTHRTTIAGLIAVLTIHAGLLSWSAAAHSPVSDELGHLAAGLSHWKLHRFELFAVNPPLVRSLATVRVALGDYSENWTRYAASPARRQEFRPGLDFVRANPDSFIGPHSTVDPPTTVDRRRPGPAHTTVRSRVSGRAFVPDVRRETGVTGTGVSRELA